MEDVYTHTHTHTHTRLLLLLLLLLLLEGMTFEKVLQEAFSRIAQCDTIRDMFHDCFGENHDIEVLTGMNEVYVSSPHTVKNTSDEVFYTRHI